MKKFFLMFALVISGGGSTETGFTQYIDGVLSFAYNGANINITPTN